MKEKLLRFFVKLLMNYTLDFTEFLSKYHAIIQEEFHNFTETNYRISHFFMCKQQVALHFKIVKSIHKIVKFGFARMLKLNT